jgi:tRNA(Ile)-lysidine synthase
MPPNPLVDRVAEELRALGLAGGRMLIAVSGGIDSIALLRAACAVRDRLGLQIVVGHYNHRFRGAAAEADAAWVAALADRLQIECTIGVAERDAATSGTIPEESARQERYAFLTRTAIARHCVAILTAHTADDQVETVLHHLFRGTGLAGLCGIPRDRMLSDGMRLVRPLLTTSRQELERSLQALGQDYRTDVTNVDVTMTRNWLRHVALPLLRQRFPNLDAAVQHLSQQADDVDDLVADLAVRLLAAATLDDGPDGVRLRVAALAQKPRHLVRSVFVRLWDDHGWPRQAMGYDRWNELADLVAASTGTLTLPGAIEARRRDDLLVITRRER